MGGPAGAAEGFKIAIFVATARPYEHTCSNPNTLFLPLISELDSDRLRRLIYSGNLTPPKMTASP
jgi:hypothetical protein